MIHVQAALHAFGSICGVDRQEDQMKLDGQAEEYLKRLVYTTAANSSKLTPSVSSNSFLVCPFILAYGSGLLSWVFFFGLIVFQALLLSILQQDPDIRIAVSS